MRGKPEPKSVNDTGIVGNDSDSLVLFPVGLTVRFAQFLHSVAAVGFVRDVGERAADGGLKQISSFFTRQQLSNPTSASPIPLCQTLSCTLTLR